MTRALFISSRCFILYLLAPPMTLDGVSEPGLAWNLIASMLPRLVFRGVQSPSGHGTITIEWLRPTNHSVRETDWDAVEEGGVRRYQEK